jgi:hypothetical protein
MFSSEHAAVEVVLGPNTNIHPIKSGEYWQASDIMLFIYFYRL